MLCKWFETVVKIALVCLHYWMSSKCSTFLVLHIGLVVSLSCCIFTHMNAVTKMSERQPTDTRYKRKKTASWCSSSRSSINARLKWWKKSRANEETHSAMACEMIMRPFHILFTLSGTWKMMRMFTSTQLEKFTCSVIVFQWYENFGFRWSCVLLC